VLELSNSFYEVYQNKLKELNYLDYDDLLYFAYKLLKNQESIRAYYQNFYEYILEDEAQDSNLLQNKIVALITNKNLVKVGDSNQNITGTFTLSSPKLFRNFCAKTPCVMSLNISYRSSKNIIDFSNLFLKYTSLKHPCLNARKALKMNFMSFNKLELGNDIESDKNKIRAYYAESFEEEILICLKKVKAFKKKFPEKTIGILCPKNANVTSLARKFEEESIEFEILNDYDQDNFNTYKKLSDILSFMHNPNNTSTFIRIFRRVSIKC
jgi:Superfamily I DNA and RNA helicases